MWGSPTAFSADCDNIMGSWQAELVSHEEAVRGVSMQSLWWGIATTRPPSSEKSSTKSASLTVRVSAEKLQRLAGSGLLWPSFRKSAARLLRHRHSHDTNDLWYMFTAKRRAAWRLPIVP